MLNFRLVLVTLFVLSVTLMNEASAQVIRRGPRYNPNPHRPFPGPVYRPVPVPRPVPAPVPRPYPQDDYYNRGRITCSATDQGWEEHWSGHASCGACLQAHGNCTERCTEERQVCEVQGTDFYGRTMTFMAVGGDRFAAESEARRQCEWDRDMRSCVTVTCRSDDRLVSSRSCR